MKREPRLHFSDADLAEPKLKKSIKRVEKAAEKADKAQAKIPKKTVIKKERGFDPATGKVKTHLRFEEVDKKKPPSKLSHAVTAAPANTVLATAHRRIRETEEDNVGTQSAHKMEEVAEGGVRTVSSAHRSHKLKPYRNAARAEAKADKANIKALNKQSKSQNPQFSSNPYSRWQQKRAIKKEYMAAKKSGANTVKAGQTTAKAAKKAAENTKKSAEFVAKHWKGSLIALGLLMIVAFLLSTVFSCSMLVQGGVSAIGASSYATTDEDMKAAEAQYCALEDELQRYLDTYESIHDYDEYHYDLDDIEHDPYVLISILSAIHGNEWTISEVGGTLQMLFEKQYILTETVRTETRYRTETRTGTRSYTDPDTGETVIEEALSDERFAAMMEEAEKYLGYPYVWGGSSPSTSFDCSGFVSYVVNNCGQGWSIGRLGADGLRGICTRVSKANARPSDLIFFQGTYDTTGASHVGIYVGNNILLIIAGGAGGAVYWFKFKKEKPKTKGNSDLDDYDFGEDEDDYDEETEIDDADVMAESEDNG